MQLLSTHIAKARAKSSDDGRTLLLSKVGISVVSSTVIVELNRVERLALSNNFLTDLPTDFSRLTSLRYLNLKGNQFTAVPDALTSLPSLDTLDLSHNKLTTFPLEAGQLLNLKTLILTRNLLKSLPSYICKFEQLKNLVVDRNPLEWPPKAVIDVPSKKDSDEGMADWVHSLQMWMDADISQNGLYSNRQDDSGYSSADAGKDLESSLEDSFNSWSRFGGSMVSLRSSHRRGSSASSNASLHLTRTASSTSTSDFGHDSSPSSSSRGGPSAIGAPHSRNFSIDSSFSIDSIAESEFEDADPDANLSISTHDSDYMNIGYSGSKIRRHGALHRHGPSYASSISHEPGEIDKEDGRAGPSLRLGMLQSFDAGDSPTRSLFERDARESYLPSPAHSDDRGFFDNDTSSVIVRENHSSILTDSSSTSTLTAGSRDSHQRNRSYASYNRGTEIRTSVYGTNSLAKKSLPDLRTAKLNFTKTRKTPNQLEREVSLPIPVPPSTHHNNPSIVSLQRRRQGPSSANGADEDSMPSPVSQRQDSGSSHSTSAGSTSGRSFSGGIRPLFAGTGRAFDPSLISPTRPPISNGTTPTPPPLPPPTTSPPVGGANLHHTPSLASERNLYFRRLSTLPGHSRTLPAPLLVLVDSARSILFALSQIFQGLEAFVLNEAASAPLNESVGPLGDGGDRITLILRKVIGPASSDLKSLIASLSHFDDLWAKRTVPSPGVCRTVVESCKDAVSAFGKVMNVLALQLPILFSSVETQKGKKGAEDARFERGLLLMLYGAMGEVAGAWNRLRPVSEELLPLINETKETNHPTSHFEGYSFSSNRQPPRGIPGRPPQRPPLTHVARRNAGSFSIQDVEMGKIMPEIEEPVPGSALSPTVNASSRLTLRAPKRKVSAASSAGGSPFSAVGVRGDSEFGRPSFSHSREGSQASLAGLSPSSSPLMQSKASPSFLDPSSAASKSSITVDSSALYCVREVLNVAALVWDGLEDVLIGHVDEVEEKQVRESLASGRAVTRRLGEVVSPTAKESSLQGLGDDTKTLLKTIVQLSQAYKNRFGSYTPDEALRIQLAQLNTSATELAIFLRVASFSTTSPSLTSSRTLQYSPQPSSGTPSPGITTTIAPPTPSPSMLAYPPSPAAPRSAEESNRPRIDIPSSARAGLSRSRSAQAQATAKLGGNVSFDDSPKSAQLSSFQMPPLPISPFGRGRDLTLNVGDLE